MLLKMKWKNEFNIELNTQCTSNGHILSSKTKIMVKENGEKIAVAN